MYQKGGAVGFQETFKALSDSTRREILDLLKDASISHHLNILKQANLITDKKQGKYIYYELNLSVFEEVIHWFQSFKEDK